MTAMADSTIWWALTGAAVAVELVTGTFYSLMFSLGMAAAAIAAHLGATASLQLMIAAVVGGGSVLAWRAYKQKSPSSPPAGANHDVNMDVGETVVVASWTADGSSSVKYRGANWAVSLAPGESPSTGVHKVVEVVGSRLIVKKI
jgi:membrane protein implicated in regulation of membrane protease activity